MTPYRTPAAAPSAPPRPTWRRRLAATLPLPASWRWVRAAKGGAWERVEFAPTWCACGRPAHDYGAWARAPHPQRETVQRLPDALVIRREGHGPPVAPLRLSTAWRWRLAALVGVVAIVAATCALALVAPHWLAGGVAGLLTSAWVAYCNERLRAALERAHAAASWGVANAAVVAALAADDAADV